MVLEMADGHVSGVEAENGCASLVIARLIDRAIFPREQRESWPLVHLKIVETQSKLAISLLGSQRVYSVKGWRCTLRCCSALSRRPGPGDTSLSAVALLGHFYGANHRKTACDSFPEAQRQSFTG